MVHVSLSVAQGFALGTLEFEALEILVLNRVDVARRGTVPPAEVGPAQPRSWLTDREKVTPPLRAESQAPEPHFTGTGRWRVSTRS